MIVALLFLPKFVEARCPLTNVAIFCHCRCFSCFFCNCSKSRISLKVFRFACSSGMVEIMVFQQKGRICWNTAVTPRGPKFLRHFAATFAQPGVGRRILMAGVVPISGSIFPWTVKLNENPFTILPFRIEFTEFWCPNSNDKSRLRGPLAAGLAAPAHAENWLGTPGKMRFFRARIGCTRLRNTFETCCLLETAMTSKLCKETYSIISIGCGDFVMQRNLVWLRTIPTRWNSVPPGFCRNWGSMSFGASRRMNKSLKAKRRMWSRTASVRHVIRRIHPSVLWWDRWNHQTAPWNVQGSTLFLFVPLMKCFVIQLWRQMVTCFGPRQGACRWRTCSRHTIINNCSMICLIICVY